MRGSYTRWQPLQARIAPLMSDAGEIKDVSDTAIWVAYYRAQETERPDALFRDPLASRLVGERGAQIARRFGSAGKYTAWTLVSRTVLIDEYIREGIADGVDAVLNLGAGLDTRPYRMELPATLQWVEADFPHMIDYKNRILTGETPRCGLRRVAVDLSDGAARRRFLADVLSGAKKVLVLTEGVIPYLTEEQVAELAEDLRAQPRFACWIGEYFTPNMYRYLKMARRSRVMANAPFQFFPADWLGFFAAHGWVEKQIRYGYEVAIKYRRRPPFPWWAQLLMRLRSRKQQEWTKRMSGYQLLVPKST
jgi:methyltransferase (TIGR00027 family)